MYKKIMFLIITLSIIINVGNSTVVMAKENIVTEIVDFPVTINYEEYNVDDYNANDMVTCSTVYVSYLLFGFVNNPKHTATTMIAAVAVANNADFL